MDIPVEAVIISYGIIGGGIRTIRDTYKTWKITGTLILDTPDIFFDLFFGGSAAGLVWLLAGDTITFPFTKIVVFGLIGIGGFGADLIDPLMDKAKAIFGGLLSVGSKG